MFPFPFSFIAPAADVPVGQIANAEAMSFNGTDTYVAFPATPNTGDISISFWVKHSTGGICVIASGDGVFNYLRFWNEQKVSIIIANQKYYLTTDIKDGNWHHVVVTNDTSANEIKGYTDGSLTQTHSLSVNSNNVKTIGAYQNGSLWFFNGAIDEVGIWNTVLTSTQVAEIYNATAVVNGVPQTANLFTGGLSSSLVYWNRMGDS